jgi:hypothetical protein
MLLKQVKRFYRHPSCHEALRFGAFEIFEWRRLRVCSGATKRESELGQLDRGAI